MQKTVQVVVSLTSILLHSWAKIQRHTKGNKISDHSDSMLSVSQSAVFIVQKRNLHNLKKGETKLETKAEEGACTEL